ncbi:hypothetical protein CEXT_236401 [Caerostris extrusa]|uniref:Uncharacterized protein n=1 Tax=Caerostris extrusa TaxID=172846 RepID=A0AAV4RVW8_CAEEX|nr:hypothetical protein CEXT_236401 [Caerostris extrusa]
MGASESKRFHLSTGMLFLGKSEREAPRKCHQLSQFSQPPHLWKVGGRGRDRGEGCATCGAWVESDASRSEDVMCGKATSGFQRICVSNLLLLIFFSITMMW